MLLMKKNMYLKKKMALTASLIISIYIKAQQTGCRNDWSLCRALRLANQPNQGVAPLLASPHHYDWGRG